MLLLAGHFLRSVAAGRQAGPAHLSPAAIGWLRGHGWPGGVRELRRVIEAADILSGGAEIRLEHLPRAPSRAGGLFSVRLEGVESVDLQAEVGRFERVLLDWALARAGGSQTRAAEMLGVPRTTLQTKLARG